MSDHPKLSEDADLNMWVSEEFKHTTHFRIHLDDGLTILPGATEEDMIRVAGYLNGKRQHNSQVIRVIDRFLGDLISHHSKVNDCTWAESIQALKLCDSDGRSMRSLSRLPRIVEKLDADVLALPGLTTKHFDVATSFKSPAEGTPDEGVWRQDVKEILNEAAENPVERGSMWVADKMKALQKTYGIDTGKQNTSMDALRRLAETSYILSKWTPSDFDDRKIERSVVADFHESLLNEVITRGIISSPDDPITYIPFWEADKKKAKEEGE